MISLTWDRRLLTWTAQCEPRLTPDLDSDDVPPYAILSHTWGTDVSEFSFVHMQTGQGRDKVGYGKVQFCGEQAKKDGIGYFWIDTCCIDRANHTELSEAITSMFRWYKNSAKCYVYLSDVSANQFHIGTDQMQHVKNCSFESSRWFTRGWTLQELLAPTEVEFFSREARFLGTKRSLAVQIHKATTIPLSALHGTQLSRFSIAERLRWTEKRETKKEEDKAYSVLGIFDVFMPLLYGEGSHALRRLHKEIGDRHGAHATVPFIKKGALSSCTLQVPDYNLQLHQPCQEQSRTNLERRTGKDQLPPVRPRSQSPSIHPIPWLNSRSDPFLQKKARTSYSMFVTTEQLQRLRHEQPLIEFHGCLSDSHDVNNFGTPELRAMVISGSCCCWHCSACMHSEDYPSVGNSIIKANGAYSSQQGALRHRTIINEYLNTKWISKIPAPAFGSLYLFTTRCHRPTVPAQIREPHFTYYAEGVMKCFELCVRSWELQTSFIPVTENGISLNWVDFRNRWRDVTIWTTAESTEAILAINNALTSFQQIAVKAFERPRLELFERVASILLDPRLYVQPLREQILCAANVMLVACEGGLGRYHPLSGLIRLVTDSMRSNSRLWQPVAHGYVHDLIAQCSQSEHILQGAEDFLPSLTELSIYIASGWGDHDGAERQLLATLQHPTCVHSLSTYLENSARYHYAHVLLSRNHDDSAFALLQQVRQTYTSDFCQRNNYIRQVATQHLALGYIRRGSVNEAFSLYGNFLGDFADLWRSKDAVVVRNLAEIVTELDSAGHADQSQSLRARFPDCAKFVGQRTLTPYRRRSK